MPYTHARGNSRKAKDSDADLAVFRSDGARRMLSAEGADLSDDERALLVALVRVEAASGNALSAADQAVLEDLEEELTDYDVEQLAQAIDYVVTAKPCSDRKLNWGKLKERLRKPSCVK